MLVDLGSCCVFSRVRLCLVFFCSREPTFVARFRHNPLYWKYVDLNTKFKRSAIWTGVSVVRSARPASFSIFCSAACTVPSIGTLVNSDSTSTDTMISWSWISSLAMAEAKSVEFFTVKFELPARGDNTLAKKADRSYAKVLIRKSPVLKIQAHWSDESRLKSVREYQ